MSYLCQSCGYRAGKWMGFCPQCRSPEPLLGEVEQPRRTRSASTPVPLGKVGETAAARITIGIGEIDRVLGGGLVPGAAILLGGEPGVGKSTLLLQAAGSLAAAGSKVLIATAEESADQVGLRANRLGITSDDVLLLAEDDVDAIVAAAEELRPDLLVVDSVQAIAAAEVGSSPGGVAQVRESAARVVRFARDRGVATVLVGHVTKDGGIAGPKLLEHTVDVVLYLEGEADQGLRVLRSLKNRFGATHLVGLFEMQHAGMIEVADPSAAFIGGWQGSVPGTVVFPTVQGRRPVLVELQALVVPTSSHQPRRSARGLEIARVHQLLAALERHTELKFSGSEVYVGVVGGFTISETGSDLPLSLALASSLLEQPLGTLAAWGEVGLTGELRGVGHDQRRREEAGRLGVTRVISPRPGRRRGIRQALEEAGLELSVTPAEAVAT